MFGIGMPELLLIGIVGIIVIGPQKLPDVLRALGRGLTEFRRATNELKRDVEMEVNRLSETTQIKEVKQEFENDLGSVASKVNQVIAPKENIEKRLDQMADAMELEARHQKAKDAES